LPENQESITILKEVQRDIFDGFTDLVKLRRKDKLKESEDKIFTGAFWSGKKSVELGLVDAIADMRSKMKEKFGDDVEIVQISIKKGFIKSLLSEKVSEVLFRIEERLSFNKFGL
jgi:ClpP class serine protease